MKRNRFHGRRFPPTSKFLAASILATPSALAVGADAPSAPSDASTQLQEVVVTGQYEFLSVDTSGTTNLPLPIEKVPQSISLVSQDFIKAADLKTIGDIADYVPGAFNEGPSGGFSNAVSLRGYTPIKAYDGLDIGAAGLPAFDPDYSIFDRVEVVKGPSSVVYGVSSAGGLINYVTKSATPQTPDYLLAQLGMWDSYRVEGQVAGSLDSSGSVRAIGVAAYDQGDSFIDVQNHKELTLYGGINVDLSSSLTGYFHAGYMWWKRTASDGLSTYPDGVYPYPEIPRSFFVGATNDNFTTPDYLADMGLTWHATDMLDFNLKGNYVSDVTSGNDPFSYGLQYNGDLSLNRQTLRESNLDWGVALSSTYKFDALGLKDSFVSLNAMYQDSEYKYLIYGYLFPNGQSVVNGNIFAGEAALASIFDSATALGPLELNEAEFLRTLTLSTQSVVHVVDSVALLLGASYSKPDVILSNFGVSQNFTPPSQISYRGGVTYEFLPGANAYLSYSQSFLPQTYLTPNLTVLPPLKGDQYEGGVKYRAPNGHLLLTAALFQITERNQPEFAELIGPLSYYNAEGEDKHKGFELEALGQISPQWQIHVGYSYLDPKITENTIDPTTVGQIEPFIPEQTASLFSTYTVSSGFLRGLTVGGGFRYVGPQRTNIPNNSTFDIPGYELVDTTIAYAINHWTVQLNARNILNKFYFYNDYQTLSFSNLVGPPASVTLTVRRNF
jgi:iron complex outermembrane receptor protein